MSAPPVRLLWAAIAVLAACLAVEWLWPGGDAAGGAAPLHRIARKAASQAVAARDTSGWGETVLARPLFSISRRPARILAGRRADTPAGQARLSGILISRYGRRALFAPEGGGKQLVLAEGAAINESTIQRIAPDQVVLASGIVLKPSFDRTRVGPPAFQPAMIGLPNPGYPNPGLVNPGFPNPGFPNPGFPQPGLPQPVPNGAQAGEDGVPPVQPAPSLLRGAMIPQRRD